MKSGRMLVLVALLVGLIGGLAMAQTINNPDTFIEATILDSTSKCNCQGGMCGEEYLVWGSKAKCLSRPMIEPLHCFVDLFSGNTC